MSKATLIKTAAVVASAAAVGALGYVSFRHFRGKKALAVAVEAAAAAPEETVEIAVPMTPVRVAMELDLSFPPVYKGPRQVWPEVQEIEDAVVIETPAPAAPFAMMAETLSRANVDITAPVNREPAQVIEMPTRLEARMELFLEFWDSLVAEGKKITFDPSWHGGDYFSPIVDLKLPYGYAVTQDGSGRKLIILSTRYGNLVMFQRYSGNESSTITYNACSVIESLLDGTSIKLENLQAIMDGTFLQSIAADYVTLKDFKKLLNNFDFFWENARNESSREAGREMQAKLDRIMEKQGDAFYDAYENRKQFVSRRAK